MTSVVVRHLLGKLSKSTLLRPNREIFLTVFLSFKGSKLKGFSFEIVHILNEIPVIAYSYTFGITYANMVSKSKRWLTCYETKLWRLSNFFKKNLFEFTAAISEIDMYQGWVGALHSEQCYQKSGTTTGFGEYQRRIRMINLSYNSF
jgi:hypothetical protein